MNNLHYKILLVLTVISQRVRCLNTVLKSLEPCDADTSKYISWASIRNITHVGNYVHTAQMSITLGRDLGDTSIFKATFYKGKRKLPVGYQGRNLCKGLASILGDCFNSVIQQFNRPASCPIKKALFVDQPVRIDTKLIKLQLPIKGEFRVELVGHDVVTNNVTGCVELISELF